MNCRQKKRLKINSHSILSGYHHIWENYLEKISKNKEIKTDMNRKRCIFLQIKCSLSFDKFWKWEHLHHGTLWILQCYQFFWQHGISALLQGFPHWEGFSILGGSPQPQLNICSFFSHLEKSPQLTPPTKFLFPYSKG